MRNFLKLTMMLFLSAMVASCVQSIVPDKQSEYLDVTPNNIAGVWRMESFDNGIEMPEDASYYIEFNRAERTFAEYDISNSMGWYKRTGRYDIFVDSYAVITGKFDNGQGYWEHDFYVRDLTAERMVWIATDDEEVVQVYVRAELPDWIVSENK